MFSNVSKKTLAKAALFQDAPVYVQFYVTARCNLTCEQCNIIYTNADVREATIDEIERIIFNYICHKLISIYSLVFSRDQIKSLLFFFPDKC